MKKADRATFSIVSIARDFLWMGDFILSPDAVDLLSLWYGAREGRTIPTRALIDPLKLRRWVGNISVIHVHDGQKMFYVALHGAHVARHFGPDFNKKYLEDVIPEVALDDALLPYLKSIETGTPHYSIQRRTLDNRLFERLERMILPCSGLKSDRVERFLVWVSPMKEGCSVSDQDSDLPDVSGDTEFSDKDRFGTAQFFPLSDEFLYQPSMAMPSRSVTLSTS